MRRVPHSWREAYELALIEPDPIKAVGRIEYAMYVLERRHSEWSTDPGTPAELAAIQTCISALVRLMKQNPLRTHGAVPETSTGSLQGTKQEVSENRAKDADYSSGIGAS